MAMGRPTTPRKTKTQRASADRSTKMAQSYTSGYEGTPASQRKAGSKSVGMAGYKKKATATSKYPTKGGKAAAGMGAKRASSDRSTKMAQSYTSGYEGTPASQRKAGSKSTGMPGYKKKATATSKYPTKGGRPVARKK